MLARNGTYWRMLAFSFLHISFIGTIALVVLYGSIKIFHLKIALGLALGESWPLLAQPQKNTDVHKGMLLWESFPKQTCKNYLRRKQFFCASLRRSLSHGNEHHGIDPNMLSSGHHDCSTKAVFLCTADKLQCWPMLARNGTYWRLLAFSFLSFIGTTASVVLYGSIKIFHLKIALGLALGESWPLGRCLRNHRKTLMSTKACFCGKAIMALIQTCYVQAIMTVPQRLSFPAQLTNCNVGPCWHVMGHIGACWHSAFSTFHSLGQ